MQAHGILYKKGPSLNKSMTTDNDNLRKARIAEI